MVSAALTVNEVVAISGVEEGKVRKDVEHGFFGLETPPQFDRAALVYFRVMAELGIQPLVEDRRKIFALIAKAFSGVSEPANVEVSPVLELKLAKVTREVTTKLARFEAWKSKRVVIDPNILGGEPVFPKSRLSVRHIGALLINDGLDEVREDYPYLKSEDLEFAKLYALAYPKRGRPRAGT